MADNVVMDPGAGGETLASDDIGGIQYPRTKVVWGADGTANDADAASGKALPVQGEAAENAAVTGNPVQVGGRFDSSPRTLGDGDVGAIALDADGAVQISDGGNSITVDGTVTADAGTNLNTSALALETGGNLADVKTSVEIIDDAVDVEGGALASGVLLQGDDGTDRKNVNVDPTTGDIQVDVTNSVTVEQSTAASLNCTEASAAAIATSVDIMDDWDETNRCAVNLISGQVGVQGGSGVDTALTQRVSLATDVALPAGTNAIGKLAANDGVDIGDVTVNGQPARDRLTDNIGVALQTDTILDDTTALTPKFARINNNTSGDNELVAAVVGKKIRVLSITLVSAGNVTVTLESGTAGNFLAGPFEFDGSTQPKGVAYSFSPVGHFETVSGESLNMILDAAINVGGSLVYVEV